MVENDGEWVKSNIKLYTKRLLAQAADIDIIADNEVKPELYMEFRDVLALIKERFLVDLNEITEIEKESFTEHNRYHDLVKKQRREYGYLLAHSFEKLQDEMHDLEPSSN